MSNSIASFTQLFIVFIVVFGGISLLMSSMMSYNAIIFLILPIFGLTLGLLSKPRNVKVVIKIVLWIFSIAAVGYLFFWFITNMLPIIYISFWLILYSPVILLVLIGYYFIRLRKSKSTNANIGVALMITGIGTLVYLCWWFLTTEWFTTSALPILLLIPIGYFAVILFSMRKTKS